MPAQPSLRRLRQFGVRPNRELGQNFLVDSNLLDVIGRLAELDERDVVLEVGGGLGVLSEYLAPRAAFLHVVEVDRALAETYAGLQGRNDVSVSVESECHRGMTEPLLYDFWMCAIGKQQCGVGMSKVV